MKLFAIFIISSLCTSINLWCLERALKRGYPFWYILIATFAACFTGTSTILILGQLLF